MTELKSALQSHEEAEEEFVYPVFKKHTDLKDLTLEAYEEHTLIDELLNKIHPCETTKDTTHAQITVLQENLLHHIQEEEGQLFPKAEKLLTAQEKEEMDYNISRFKPFFRG